MAQAVVNARRNGDKAIRVGDIALAFAIVSPRCDRAIIFEAQAVPTARRDADKDIRVGDIALAIVIVSPGRDRAIIFEAQAVETARRDGGKAGAHVSADNLAAPADNRTRLSGLCRQRTECQDRKNNNQNRFF